MGPDTNPNQKPNKTQIQNLISFIIYESDIRPKKIVLLGLGLGSGPRPKIYKTQTQTQTKRPKYILDPDLNIFWSGPK